MVGGALVPSPVVSARRRPLCHRGSFLLGGSLVTSRTAFSVRVSGATAGRSPMPRRAGAPPFGTAGGHAASPSPMQAMPFVHPGVAGRRLASRARAARGSTAPNGCTGNPGDLSLSLSLSLSLKGTA
eukprot:80263-Chlamydomonas_euryale.AAC.1